MFASIAGLEQQANAATSVADGSKKLVRGLIIKLDQSKLGIRKIIFQKIIGQSQLILVVRFDLKNREIGIGIDLGMLLFKLQ